MKFDWDVGKENRNFHKHGIAFDMAITAFDDPFALVAIDDKHLGAGEIREWLIGESGDGLLVVVFTRREEGRVYRIISARLASRRERRRYEEFKRISI